MSLRKKIMLEWGGKNYPLLVTMQTVIDLENEINLTALNLKVAQGDYRISHLCELIALVLNEAGAEVSAEDVFTEVYTGDDFSIKDLILAVNLIMSAVFPEPDELKKPNPTESSKAA